ncbi:MAG: hypothetical protein ACRC6M_02475 [Microcystaceae cyanobacterium]
MKVTYQDGNLSLDLVDLIHEMTEQEQLEIVETLSCQNAIIEFVGEQITRGWTVQGGLRGGRDWGSAEPYTPLDKLMREIANKSGEIAEKEIKRLCDLVEFHKKQTKEKLEKLVLLEKRLESLNAPHPLCQ